MSDETQTEEKKSELVSLPVAEYNQLKSQLQGLQSYKLKLDEKESELATLKASVDELKSKKTPSRDEIEQQLRTEFGERLTSYEQEKADLAAKLKRLTVTDKVMSLIGDSILPDAKKFIRMEIEKECDLDGDFESGKIVIKDDNGNKRWSTKTPDKEMDAEEYVSEILRNRYQSFFKSDARSSEPQQGESRHYTGNTGGQTFSLEKAEKMSQEQLNELALKDPLAFKRALQGL
jgi:hypothetical protein